MPEAEDDEAPLRHAGCIQAVYWAQLAQAHLRSNNITAAKQVFSRCMLTCLSMDVWMTYLQFIKQVRIDTFRPKEHSQANANII